MRMRTSPSCRSPKPVSGGMHRVHDGLGGSAVACGSPCMPLPLMSCCTAAGPHPPSPQQCCLCARACAPAAVARVTKDDDEYALTEDEEALHDEGIDTDDDVISPGGYLCESLGAMHGALTRPCSSHAYGDNLHREGLMHIPSHAVWPKGRGGPACTPAASCTRRERLGGAPTCRTSHMCAAAVWPACRPHPEDHDQGGLASTHPGGACRTKPPFAAGGDQGHQVSAVPSLPSAAPPGVLVYGMWVGMQRRYVECPRLSQAQQQWPIERSVIVAWPTWVQPLASQHATAPCCMSHAAHESCMPCMRRT